MKAPNEVLYTSVRKYHKSALSMGETALLNQSISGKDEGNRAWDQKEVIVISPKMVTLT